jgi:hypothetical protein
MGVRKQQKEFEPPNELHRPRRQTLTTPLTYVQKGGGGHLQQEGLKGLQADGGMLLLAEFAVGGSQGSLLRP